MTPHQTEAAIDNCGGSSGVGEVLAAVPLAVTPWLPKLSILGSVPAIVAFVTTVSFPVTAPGMFEAAVGGFPAPSMTGGFPTEDVALPVTSVRAPAHALRATRSTLSGSSQDYAGY